MYFVIIIIINRYAGTTSIIDWYSSNKLHITFFTTKYLNEYV